ERQQLGHQDPALSIPARPVHLPRLPEADADLRLPDGGVGVLADSSILGIRHATMLRTTRARGTGGSAGTGAGERVPVSGTRSPVFAAPGLPPPSTLRAGPDVQVLPDLRHGHAAARELGPLAAGGRQRG